MTNDELHQRIERLEAQVDELAYKEKQHSEYDGFSRTLANMVWVLIISVLSLIFMAIYLRHDLEVRRINARPMAPLAGPPADSQATPAGDASADAKRALDNYVDRAGGKGSTSSSYSLSLSGLGEIVQSLVKTGQITAEKASSLMHELGKHAIATTGEILKETAKAIIARHLAPPPERKETVSTPAQQVQVNVYASEKQVVVKPPKTPQPKPPCKTPAAETKPAACQSEARPANS